MTTSDGHTNGSLEDIFNKFDELNFSRMPVEDLSIIPGGSKAFQKALYFCDDNGTNTYQVRPRSHTMDSSYSRKKSKLSVRFSENLIYNPEGYSSDESVSGSGDEKPKKLSGILLRRTCSNESSPHPDCNSINRTFKTQNKYVSIPQKSSGLDDEEVASTDQRQVDQKTKEVDDHENETDENTVSDKPFDLKVEKQHSSKKHQSVFDRLSAPKERYRHLVSRRPMSAGVYRTHSSTIPMISHRKSVGVSELSTNVSMSYPRLKKKYTQIRNS